MKDEGPLGIEGNMNSRELACKMNILKDFIPKWEFTCFHLDLRQCVIFCFLLIRRLLKVNIVFSSKYVAWY